MSRHPALQAGNRAVVTGAADGIGLATVERLVDLGLAVAALDVAGEKLREATARLGDKVTIHEVDVADRAAVEAVAGAIGPVAFLMNNAGVGGGGDALSNPEGWTRVLGTNLFGVLHGVQAFVPQMIAARTPGIVVNTGSKQGITQPPGDTAYNVSKSGVKALTEGLAHTLRSTPGCAVTAHLLIPGFTYTGMSKARMPEKPPAAWTPEQVVEVMLNGIERGDFYLWCEDNETSRAVDERRIAWAGGDLIENRPALSRWHPDWKDAFAAFVADV